MNNGLDEINCVLGGAGLTAYQDEITAADIFPEGKAGGRITHEGSRSTGNATKETAVAPNRKFAGKVHAFV